jgi:hypothetical protein
MFLAAAHNTEPLGIHARFKQAVGGIQEIVAVVLHMETYKVATEHAFKYFILVWADHEGLGRRPGYMPEQGYFRLRPFLLYHLRQERKMIILHEDKRAPAGSSLSRLSANFWFTSLYIFQSESLKSGRVCVL